MLREQICCLTVSFTQRQCLAADLVVATVWMVQPCTTCLGREDTIGLCDNISLLRTLHGND